MLKSVNDNSEDLQTAAESLAKLLKDIQNPNGENDMSQVVALDEGTPTKTNEGIWISLFHYSTYIAVF